MAISTVIGRETPDQQAITVDNDDPKNYHAAIRLLDANKWIAAYEDETKSLENVGRLRVVKRTMT